MCLITLTNQAMLLTFSVSLSHFSETSRETSVLSPLFRKRSQGTNKNMYKKTCRQSYNNDWFSSCRQLQTNCPGQLHKLRFRSLIGDLHHRACSWNSIACICRFETMVKAYDEFWQISDWISWCDYISSFHGN